MKRALIVLAAFVVALLLCGSELIDQRSEIRAENEEIDTRWTQVDRDMKKRAGQISALLESVKGGGPERAAATELQDAREALVNARTKEEEMSANNHLDVAIQRLLFLQKTQGLVTPDAVSSAFEDELAREENEIAVDRRDYNDAIEKYNLDVELFPRNIAAAIFGFRHNDAYFKTTEKDKLPQ